MMRVLTLLSPASVWACKGLAEQLPGLLRRKGVLVTHPREEFIAPADLLKRKPDEAEGTLAVPYSFDLEHRTHAPFSAVIPLLPSTTDLMDGRQ